MRGYFEVDSKKQIILDLTLKSESENFWDDVEKANKVFKEISNLKKIVDEYEKLEIEMILLEDNLNEKKYIELENKIKDLEVKANLVIDCGKGCENFEI